MSAQPYVPLALSEFAFEVQAGLATDGQKTLPCRYFYDDVGTALFQTISLLPEYGLTRADDRVIRAQRRGAGRFGSLPRWLCWSSVVGPAPRHVGFWRLCRTRANVVYYPIDVSGRLSNAAAANSATLPRWCPWKLPIWRA